MDPNFVIEPTHVTQRQLWEIAGIGPKSYNSTTGDIINFPGTQYPSCVPGGFLTQSGTYELKSQPSITNNLRPTWAFRWYVVSTGAEVANATDLSAEKVQFFVIGGEM